MLVVCLIPLVVWLRLSKVWMERDLPLLMPARLRQSLGWGWLCWPFLVAITVGLEVWQDWQTGPPWSFDSIWFRAVARGSVAYMYLYIGTVLWYRAKTS